MDDASKKPKFIQVRHPFIKDGLSHKKGGKTGERKMMNGVSCIRFEKKETIGEVLLVQTTEAQCRNAEVPCPGGSVPKRGGSEVWQNSGTNRTKAPSQPRQQAPKASNTRL